MVLGVWMGMIEFQASADRLDGAPLQFGLTRLRILADETINANELERAIDVIKDGGTVYYAGASGPVDFDPPFRFDPSECILDTPTQGGDVRMDYVGYRVIDREFDETRLYDCARSADCEAAALP
jgi:hypothetical protein